MSCKSASDLISSIFILFVWLVFAGVISSLCGDLPQIAVGCFDRRGKLTAEDERISVLLVSFEELHGATVESGFADVFDSVLRGVHFVLVGSGSVPR